VEVARRVPIYWIHLLFPFSTLVMEAAGFFFFCENRSWHFPEP